MTKRHRKSPAGFTIVELALVLIIFGIVLSTITLGYQYYINSKKAGDLDLRLNEVQTALNEFQLNRGRLPCPAARGLPPTDVNYGRENCAVAVAPGTRPLDSDNNGVNDRVLIGVVPFMTIIDPDNDGVGFADPNNDENAYPDFVTNHAFDTWGNKVTYAVSENLTRVADYDQNSGVIDIVDEQGNSLLPFQGTAQAALISHGQNGKGAANTEGNTVDICAQSAQKQADVAAGTNTTLDETRNCIFTSAAFLNGISNDNDDDYYDDKIVYILNRSTELWQFTDTVDVNNTPLDPTDDVTQVANTNGGNVGVGASNPTEQLHVEGDVQAFGIIADKLCDSSGSDCMLPEAIAGNIPDMQCNSGEVVVSIEENRVNCSDPFPPTISGTCPTGTELVGVSSTTGIICE